MLRLYLDENIPSELAVLLRRRGFDVITAREARMLGKTDEEQLAFALHEGRALLTFDTGFIPLARSWFAQRRPHSGVIISREIKRAQMGELLRACLLLVNQASPEDMANAVIYLQQYRQSSSA